MKPSTREWIKKAEADYQLALALSRRKKVTFHDHGCFCCQQSAEKYVKARLEEAGIFSPKTHDLVKLVKLATAVEPRWSAMQASVAHLSNHAVEFRYPGHEATVREFKQALKTAKTVRREARLALGLRV
ncbi:MAG: HEPN domain-containing protein [Verrucomicrobiaceae bacterium]|nr:HEPN domain-containing protein [Verrucomicrobiaceae bacterium]